MLEIGFISGVIGLFAFLGIEIDRVISAFISQALVAADVGLFIIRIEIVAVQRVGLDRGPFVHGVVAILLALGVTVLHHFGRTIAVVDGLFFAHFPALIMTGNVIGVRGRVAAFIVVIHGLDFLHRHGCLPVHVGHSGLHRRGGREKQEEDRCTTDHQRRADPTQQQPVGFLLRALGGGISNRDRSRHWWLRFFRSR